MLYTLILPFMLGFVLWIYLDIRKHKKKLQVLKDRHARGLAEFDLIAKAIEADKSAYSEFNKTVEATNKELDVILAKLHNKDSRTTLRLVKDEKK